MALAQPTQGVEPIMPGSATAQALAKLCPDLDNWPPLWCVEPADISVAQRLLTLIKPFLLHLLAQDLAPKTLRRHRDHLCRLGGEIIRRRYDDSDLRRLSTDKLLLRLLDEEGGPLIWPRVSEQDQNAFDATCRKFYRFLSAGNE